MDHSQVSICYGYFLRDVLSEIQFTIYHYTQIFSLFHFFNRYNPDSDGM